VLSYRLARGLFRIVALPMFRFRVEGAERVPREGPGVVVAPHRSWLDPACVGGACPRPVRFLMMDTVYRRPAARWFYRRMRSIPVGAGDAPLTITALRHALRALRDGQLIGVFPEGRVVTDGALGPLQPGAAMLAARGGAPVIPVFIRGSSRAWPHGRAWPGPARVSVLIGPAIAPPGTSDRGAVERFLQRIRAGLEALAEKEEIA
jgi:1-acyl-sn-glycerol-3-phosphate acyltransferase